MTSIVAIVSIALPGTYICLDGNGVVSFTDNGGGKVTTQPHIGGQETYYLERYKDNTVSFQSTFSKNVYLRLDGTGVPAGQLVGPGGGNVNGQYTAGPYEKYRLHKEGPAGQYDGVVGIESVGFPGRYLRMAPGPVINVQGVCSTNEQFKIVVIG